MNRITVHAAACSKAKFLMGKLLKDIDYRNTMQAKDIHEFMEYLTKNTAYRDVFLEPDTIVHRHEVEIGMRRYLLTNFEKFYHYYFDNYRKFFKVLFMRYEVENLKLFIRAITREEDVHHLGEHLITSAVYSNVDYDEVLKSRNIQEFIDSLKGTIYYNLLKGYLNEESSKMQFYMEMNLDRIYFKKLKDVIVTFKGADYTYMMELLGKNSDLLNIQWIYRAKKFYNLSPEEILNYTLESGLKFDYKRLKELCYLDDVDMIKTTASKTEYNILFTDEDILMERNMERFLYSLLEELSKKGNLSIIIPLTYMHKLEYEVRDLFTILESIKYEFEDTEKYLVRVLS